MYNLDKKFIFTHPPKCGGTSLEDVFGFLTLRNKFPFVNRFKHASLKTHLEHLTSKGLDVENFFKFSIIRNPWDRAVSFYNHNKYKEYEYFVNETKEKEIPLNVKDAREMTFKQFVIKYFKNDFNSEVSTKPYMCLENNFSLDYVIKLENITEDFLVIRDCLQLDLTHTIPHINNSDKFLTRINYKEYYDNETKKIIKKFFEWDIDKFKYVF